jgi:peptide/nickel transport system ATP-binding protein
MIEPLLSVRDLEIGFNTDRGLARVLDRVNFRIGKGEIVGLVGESGCGKTTLARAILGVLPKNAARIGRGEVIFENEDLLKKDPSVLEAEIRGRRITFVPQDPFTSFNPVFSIGAQLEELMKWKSPDGDVGTGLRFYGRNRRQSDRARVIKLLRTVQLPDPAGILRKYPHEVSGGQRQRLMIAMALLPEPRLIIADEPTTALDVTIQAQILKLLRRLATEFGVSVLFTTHDLGTAYEICDQITVMYAGQEVESAPSDEFFAAPRHPYTKRLLESLPSRERGISGIPGSIPGLVAPPSGCRFHPRCDFATAECAETRPGVTDAGERHIVRCYHPVAGKQEAAE